MKAQIEEIFLRLYENVQHGVEWSHAQNEIEQLMCYREVRALINWVDPNHFVIDLFEKEIIEQLLPEYPESMITPAIERVKSESK